MNKILLLTFVLFPLSTYAMDKSLITNQWQLNPQGVPIIGSTDAEFAAIVYDTNNSISVGFSDTLDQCRASAFKESNAIWDINGTYVNMKTECIQQARTYLPMTDKGERFVTQQFRIKPLVKVAGHVFSAKNFTKVVDEANSLKDKAI